jgi:hypothetical protein
MSKIEKKLQQAIVFKLKDKKRLGLQTINDNTNDSKVKLWIEYSESHCEIELTHDNILSLTRCLLSMLYTDDALSKLIN